MQSKHIGPLYVVYTHMAQNLYNIKFVIVNMIDIVANNMISISEWRQCCCMYAMRWRLIGSMVDV
jgi:hypothetical protein